MRRPTTSRAAGPLLPAARQPFEVDRERLGLWSLGGRPGWNYGHYRTLCQDLPAPFHRSDVNYRHHGDERSRLSRRECDFGRQSWQSPDSGNARGRLLNVGQPIGARASSRTKVWGKAPLRARRAPARPCFPENHFRSSFPKIACRTRRKRT